MVYDGAIRIEVRTTQNSPDYETLIKWLTHSIGPAVENWDMTYDLNSNAHILFFSRSEDALMFSLKWTARFLLKWV